MERGGGLLGRESERRVLDALLAGARNGQGAAIVITGEPGIGKSTLLHATTAELVGVSLLQVAGYEAESAIPFAAVDRLLIPLRDAMDRLPPAQHEALEVASGVRSGPPPDRHLVGLGVLGLLALAAEDRPVVCAVDDIHLLDAESLDVLSFVARRLGAEAVALVLAGRADELPEARVAGVSLLALRGLSPDAGVELLARSLDDDIEPIAAAQIVQATGGNPLALIDLAVELSAKQLAQTSFAVEPIPIGPHLEAHYLRRVRQLSSVSQQWLVVAAADSTGRFDLIDAAARDLELGHGPGDEAEVEGLVLLGDEVRFRHPLVRSAAYNAAHGPQRRRVHAALARAADELGLVELEAWHAARSTLGTDSAVADRLERVADLAGERGGLSSRARVLKEAANLTPPGRLRNARLVAAAEAALSAGAALLAGRLLDDVDEDELDPVSLGQLISVRASICVFLADPDLTRSGAEMLRAAECFHGHAPDLEQRALVKAFDTTLPAERKAVGASLEALGRRLAAGAEVRPGPAATILRGLSALILLPYEEAVPVMREAVAVFAGLGPEDLLLYGPTSVALTTALWDADARRDVLQRTADAARDRGALQQLDTALWILSLTEVYGGSPRRAASVMEQVRELRRANGYDAEHVINVALLAWSGAPVDQVEAIAEAAGAMGFDGVRTSGEAALACRALSEGRWEEACDRLQPLLANPFLQTTPILIADFVEAAVHCGRQDEAVSAAAVLAAIAEACDSPWAWGVVHRCRGLLDPAAAEEAFQASVAALEPTILETELGRSHLVLGEWLRRNRRRREAAAHLRVARGIFERIDAPTFAARAAAELRALGEVEPDAAGAASVPELTAQELLVARMAAAGRTNAEIAATMFLSANTIDYHLRKIFQKLGVSSRRQLRDRGELG